MIVAAHLTDGDGVALAALIAATIPALMAWINARRSRKETRPNGGFTLRDAIDRIETVQADLVAQIREEVIPRLDRGAAVMAEHADRLAVVEQRQQPIPTTTVIFHPQETTS